MGILKNHTTDNETTKINIDFCHFDKFVCLWTTNDDIIQFNNDFILKQQLSASYQNQVVNAIKLFFHQLQNRKIDIDLIHRPKKYNPLPKVLAAEEVAQIINSLDNLKHKCMMSLIYSAGLRRSELLNMRVSDIDSKRMQ